VNHLNIKKEKEKKREKRLHTWVTTAAQTIQYMGDGANSKAQLRLETNGGSNAEGP